MSITTSSGNGLRRCSENGASGELAVCAAYALAFFAAGEVDKGCVVTDIKITPFERMIPSSWVDASLELRDSETALERACRRPDGDFAHVGVTRLLDRKRDGPGNCAN